MRYRHISKLMINNENNTSKKRLNEQLNQLQKPRTIPLRLLLIVPFILQIAGAVGLVGYLSLRNGQKAVNDVATQLRQQISVQIHGEIQQYINTPHILNKINATSLADGKFDMAKASNARQLLIQIQNFPFIFPFYCGNSQGQFLVAAKEETGIYLSASNQETNYHFYQYLIDDWGNKKQLHKKFGKYDPRQRPWYVSAVKAGKPIWSEFYLNG